MTTFIATKDYIAADRAVLLEGMVYEDAKVRRIRDRIAYFFGSNHPTDEERKVLEKHIYNYVFAKEANRERAIKWITDYIESNVLVIMTRKRTIKIDAISRFKMFNPETGAPREHEGLNITVINPNIPITYGSGSDLAQVGWAAGQSAEDIILTVQRIDQMSGLGYDVVYREELKA